MRLLPLWMRMEISSPRFKKLALDYEVSGFLLAVPSRLQMHLNHFGAVLHKLTHWYHGMSSKYSTVEVGIENSSDFNESKAKVFHRK
jgi:hypothetical protein